MFGGFEMISCKIVRGVKFILTLLMPMSRFGAKSVKKTKNATPGQPATIGAK